ncbi:MAG: hypothetical protein KKB95_01525 [Gammaproteobacteria bacterium]|nr:hypothetical protein [Gammaproteobacteria bacterium]MBU1504554.1 hypothetical protein [Gammaproteobacteria bacterium]MBU2119416.1 hypothetical protein [Gammaproteobacteria bacterium]MBU2202817.1 hypothetical protein [Gammaproteobacteria bacterium]MBU2272556.1 hypothetical protein [Gammaproteobacteria bacterium]
MGNRKCGPELLDTSYWPSVSIELLSQDELVRFNRCKNAVQAACDGIKSGEIAKRFDVSSSLLSYYIKRCTRTASDGRLVGFRALVKGSERLEYTRTAESTNHGYRGAGLAGAFRQLLFRYEKSAAWLALKLEPSDERKIQPGSLNISGLHQKFLDQLKIEGCTDAEYPFIAKRCGYEAFAAHLNKSINEGNAALAVMKYGKSAAQAPGRNTGKIALLRPMFPFERVAYDEYNLPNISIIEITTDDGSFCIPISRGWFCPIVDFDSYAILGYSLSIAENFNSANLTQAFEKSINPPPYVGHEFFDDLPRLSGQGLPSEIAPGVKGRRISILCLDNHLSHFSNSILIGLRKKTGVAITYGKVRSWVERNVVERIFSILQRRLVKLASTTGSGSSDFRVNDPVGNAVKFKINLSQLTALIANIVRRYNATRLSAIFGSTPNEKVAREWSDRARLQIVPKYQEEFVSDSKISIESRWVTVRGDRAVHRTPYIQLDNVPYTNDILRQSWSLIGKKLLVEIGNDYRTVLAFREDGTEFGKLSVSGAWALHPHTREVRREIFQLIRAGAFDARSSDPVLHYQDKLAREALKSNKSGRKPKLTSEANKLARAIQADSGENKSDLNYKVTSGVLVNEKPLKSNNRRSFFSPERK